MALIVIEGPEKAGKTTLIKELFRQLNQSHSKIYVRHWTGRAKPDDRIYSAPLHGAVSIPSDAYIEIWDRGWVSEYVYGTLLHQDRRLSSNPWRGEWEHGRALKANGLGVILAGPDAKVLASRRDETDLPVDPQTEQDLYTEYAFHYKWLMVEDKDTKSMASSVLAHFRSRMNSQPMVLPSMYVGPLDARVVFVEDHHTTPALPFSDNRSREFAQLFCEDALRCGWAVAHQCPPEVLRGADVLVPMGAKAGLWVKHYVCQKGGKQQVITLPHPSRVLSSRDDHSMRSTLRTISEAIY